MILRADARALPLRDGCVQCVVTSPPYWGLRDYGDAGQIGLEPTPELYVSSLLEVFREVWRVLRHDGTCWVNLGDSYAASGCGGDSGASGLQGSITSQDQSKAAGQRRGVHSSFRRDRMPRQDAPHKSAPGLKVKDLVGVPWMVAFALRAAGWYLRSDIIWAKPNPMPESVTDRPTKSHEYVFLLSKSERYHYDAAAIAEKSGSRDLRPSEKRNGFYHSGQYGQTATQHGRELHWKAEDGRNKRSVWTVPTMPYSGAHFATMPEALVEPCILAGCPIGGLVLDPFLGSGTVGAVAERLGRRWVGTDLSYQPLSKARTRQRGIPFGEAIA